MSWLRRLFPKGDGSVAGSTHRHTHIWDREADWGQDAQCRCGLVRRRMLGGYGHALEGGFWFDTADPMVHWQRRIEELSREVRVP